MKAVLFDLDNTLYPKEANLFSIMDKRINEYMHKKLKIPMNRVDDLRLNYWKEYGLTLIGLMKFYNVDTEDFLHHVHNFEIENILRPDLKLSQALAGLPLKKIIFTNSCEKYAKRVLKALKIHDHFELIFDIRKALFKPKPTPAPYKTLLEQININGNCCIMVDDYPDNLETAKKISMKTIMVGRDQKKFHFDANVNCAYEAVEIIQKWL